MGQGVEKIKSTRSMAFFNKQVIETDERAESESILA
jgi:hypothetical protein